MNTIVNRVAIFVAGPSDTEREAQDALGLIDSLDKVLGPRLGLALRGVRGNRDAPGGVGRPQSRINPLVDQCSLLLGIFNRRIGSATGQAVSGSEEEVRRAFGRHETTGSEPELILFFRKMTDREMREVEPQLRRLLKLKTELESKLLYIPYKNRAEFSRVCLEQLIQWMLRYHDLNSFEDEERPGLPRRAHEPVVNSELLGSRRKNISRKTGSGKGKLP